MTEEAQELYVTLLTLVTCSKTRSFTKWGYQLVYINNIWLLACNNLHVYLVVFIHEVSGVFTEDHNFFQ